MNNKITLELTPEQYELIKKQLECQEVEKVKKSPFDRVENNKIYYFIDCDGNILPSTEMQINVDDKYYEVANYCTDRNLLQQQAYRETLNRLLWRFSMQNGGDEIDWSDSNEVKYCIYYSHDSNTYRTAYDYTDQYFGAVCFASNEIAHRAIDEIIEPFLKQHPDFEF